MDRINGLMNNLNRAINRLSSKTLTEEERDVLLSFEALCVELLDRQESPETRRALQQMVELATRA